MYSIDTTYDFTCELCSHLVEVQCNSEYDNFHKQLFNKEMENVFYYFKKFHVLVHLSRLRYESNGTLKTVSEIPDSSLTNGFVIVRQFLSGDTISN